MPRLAQASARSRIDAIQPDDLAGLLRRRHDLVERFFDGRRVRIERGAVGERDRQVRRPDEQSIDTRRRGDRVDVFRAPSRVSIIAKVSTLSLASRR